MDIKLKNWLKRMDARFPSAKFLLRRIPLVASVAKVSGVVPPDVIRLISREFVSNCSVVGVPDTSVFKADFLKDNAWLLMGVTHSHPLLDKILVRMSVVDDKESVIYRAAQVVLTEAPIVAPEVVKSMLPDYIAWFQLPIRDLPPKFSRLHIKYSSDSMDMRAQFIASGFRFCCLIINRLDDDGGSLVDLGSCSPMYMRSAGRKQ